MTRYAKVRFQRSTEPEGHSTKLTAGSGAARNRGLKEVDDSSTLFFAFLDSDDIWPPDHLARAIEAIEQGLIFYFTDNRRVGRHESYCRLSPYTAKTAVFAEITPPRKPAYLEIPKELMIGLTLDEFPAQTSTVVYQRNIATDLRFDEDLKYTGEDVLFLTTLAARANKICFDLDSMVECGGGVNIYFSNLEPDGERFLAIKADKFVTHLRIAQRLDLSQRNRNWNDKWLALSRRDLAYHLLRSLPMKPTRAIREIDRLTRMAPRGAIELSREVFRLVLGRLAKTLTGVGKGDGHGAK